ncbi:hypothetical protein E308F_29990 [Moorella sp. E308F]|uniref:hypothetical protein n=1 Tax=Moorella sp. E308F TaxID=2572682 RepID=UPI0010FFB0ED|nr:hypothetical protein [Moorella sp. E308F]GEA16753.1 hypothetical protein E308F_29990 [Moorella sp. E308F]
MDILTEGYEDLVRSRFGVDDSDLPNQAINSPLIAGLAEVVVKKRVPDYAAASEEDKLYLQNAVIAYICYLLAPSMPMRVNVEVQTLDTRWKKGKVDWTQAAKDFLNDFEFFLSQITSVSVVIADSPICGLISGTREPIGT